MPEYENYTPVKKSHTVRNIALILGLFLLLVVCGGLAVAALSSDKDDERNTAPAPIAPQAAKSSAAVKPKVTPRPATIREGTWEVGSDVKPGKYRSSGAVDSAFPTCVWSIKKGDDYLDSGFTDKVSAPQIVTLKAGQTFESAGCKDWLKR